MTRATLSRLLGRTEVLLVIAILVLSVLFTIAAPRFLSLAHLFGIARSMIVIGFMALGLLVVLIAGGIDVSVSATAVVSMYVTVVLLGAVDFQGPVIVAVVVAGGIGAILGSVNAVLVSRLGLPSLIVTLGTLTLYHGALLAFVGTERIRDLPAQMIPFSQTDVVTVQSLGRPAGLHVGVAVLLALAGLLSWALRSTGWGRSVHAVGDDEDAARRMGVPVTRIRMTTFVLAGTLAGLAGFMSGSLNRAADPFTIVGAELDVLAAVILGGASILGGRGTVAGTILGVVLITLVGSSLVLVGIPSAWRQAFVGTFLLLGVGLPALRQRRLERARGKVVGA